jgi:hypothetical protein
MDEKEILQKQVDALEKLLQIKDCIIEEQERRLRSIERDSLYSRPVVSPYIAPMLQPSSPHQTDLGKLLESFKSTQDSCSKGGLHDYPAPLYGSGPQACTKCGKTPNFTITSATSLRNDNNV